MYLQSLYELVSVASPPILEGRSEMPANAPKVLLRSEQSGELFTRRAGEVERYFDRIAAHITGVQPPPEVITLGPPIGEPDQTDDLERRQR
jgi:hypothetical protein